MSNTLTNASANTAGSPYQTRVYAMHALNMGMQDPYSPSPLSAFDWVKDPVAGAVWAISGPSGSVPIWQRPNTWHANITFRGAVRGYFVNEEALRASLLLIKRAPDWIPEVKDTVTGVIPFRPLFTADNVTDLVRMVVDYTRLDGVQASGQTATFIIKVNELKTLLDGGFATSTTATMAAFYSKPSTVALVNAKFEVAANTLFIAAKKIYDDNYVSPIVIQT